MEFKIPSINSIGFFSSLAKHLSYSTLEHQGVINSQSQSIVTLSLYLGKTNARKREFDYSCIPFADVVHPSYKVRLSFDRIFNADMIASLGYLEPLFDLPSRLLDIDDPNFNQQFHDYYDFHHRARHLLSVAARLYGEIYEFVRLIKRNFTPEQFYIAIPSIHQLDDRLKLSLSLHHCDIDKILQSITGSSSKELPNVNLLCGISAEALLVDAAVQPFSDQTVFAVQSNLGCNAQLIWDSIIDTLSDEAIERELSDLRIKIKIESGARILRRLYTDTQSQTSIMSSGLDNPKMVISDPIENAKPLTIELFDPSLCLGYLKELVRVLGISVPELLRDGINTVISSSTFQHGVNTPFDFTAIDEISSLTAFSNYTIDG